MFQFFDFLVSLLETVVNFVVSAVEMIVFVVTFIIKGFTYVLVVIGWLPPFVSAFVLVSVSYIAIITLLKKGG